MFRSELEEKVADLLCELGIDYEYEPTQGFLYNLAHYRQTFYSLMGLFRNKGYWDSKSDRRKIKKL